MENKIYDWNLAIEQINLTQYFLYKFPNFYWDNYRKAYVDNPSASLRSNKYIFFKGRDGKQNYIYRHSGKGGNLINFIKNEICNSNEDWHKKVNEELSNFDPGIKTLVERNLQEKQTNTINAYYQRKEFSLCGYLLPLHQNQESYITEYRKISNKVMQSPLFSEVIKTYTPEEKKSYCIGIGLYNTKMDLVGLNRIFTQPNTILFNQKKFLKDSDNRTGFSKSNTLENTRTFILTESIWDAMAHFELYNPKRTEYLISNGEISITKAKEIISYLKKRKAKTIILANDNDTRGSYFNLLCLSLLIDELEIRTIGKNQIEIS